MKILLVSDYGSPNGGTEVTLVGLRAKYRQMGHDARLFTSSAGSALADGHADYTCLGTTSRFRTLLQAYNPWALIRLRRVLATFRPDVVHVNLFLTQLSPSILPLLKEIPSLYHIHWYRPICPLGTKVLPDGGPCQSTYGVACRRHRCLPLRDWAPLMLQMALWRRWRSHFNLFIANSEATRRQVATHEIKPLLVIRSGTPVIPPRPSLRTPPMVAYAGRLVRDKGLHILIRACAKVIKQIPDLKLLIAGDGPERGPLWQLATQLGIAASVELTGRVPRSELEKRFRACWVQVVPSLWGEPLGLVAVEAMMRGTAVVASNVGGLAEVVEHGASGYLVSPGNVEELAEVLLRVVSNSGLAERLGTAGRRRAIANFSEDEFANKLLEAYGRVILQGQAARWTN